MNIFVFMCFCSAMVCSIYWGITSGRTDKAAIILILLMACMVLIVVLGRMDKVKNELRRR